ncbi:hypothetical protein [Heyndrickxia acidicola]|uniref:Uncharacterized protein n=1 Tax=Heyndrickxia acidicola TaxID=209389 RepID=A0ABU6MPY7_9BACI|nr:hypothetical protein [Heyndrickxia acidicola]MED1206031.1 hypothetical protein [Heyndrickxia acidicola]
MINVDWSVRRETHGAHGKRVNQQAGLTEQKMKRTWRIIQGGSV